MKLRNHLMTLCLLSMLTSTFLASLPQTLAQEGTKSGNITFQPNMIPLLTVTDRPSDKPESFRFEWNGNRFDIELFFNATLFQKGMNITKLWSLRDFETDFAVTVNYVVARNVSEVRFGWNIENPDSTNEWVHEAWFKIEDTKPWDYDVIELETVEPMPPFQNYTITRFNLPDNLVLSFEDLYHKGFVIGWQNKTHTEVKGFSGKSSWNLDPITYSSNVITIEGFPQGSPCTFEQIWQADQDGGWGVVQRLEYNFTSVWGGLYLQKCNYLIGADADGVATRVEMGWAQETWLIESGNELTMQHKYNTMAITVWGNGHLRFGKVFDASQKATYDGVAFQVKSDPPYGFYGIMIGVFSGGTVEIYSSLLAGTPAGGALYLWGEGLMRIWNTAMSGVQLYNSNMDVYNVVVSRGWYAFAYGTSGTFDKVFIYQCEYVFYVYSPINAQNIIARNNTHAFASYAHTSNSYLVNVDSDVWDWGSDPTSTGKIFRQYEFSCISNSGSNITVYDNRYNNGTWYKVGSWIGSVTDQAITKCYYQQGNVVVSYEPLNITITKEDYQTYSANFTLTQKTSWEITLLLEVTTGKTSAWVFALGAIIAIITIPAFVLVVRRRR